MLGKYLFNVEGGAIQVALAEGATNLEFLADGECLLRTHNLQFPDASALASLQGDELGNGAEIVLYLLADEIGNLIRSVFYRPAIEVVSLLIVVVEHLR